MEFVLGMFVWRGVEGMCIMWDARAGFDFVRRWRRGGRKGLWGERGGLGCKHVSERASECVSGWMVSSELNWKRNWKGGVMKWRK